MMRLGARRLGSNSCRTAAARAVAWVAWLGLAMGAANPVAASEPPSDFAAEAIPALASLAALVPDSAGLCIEVDGAVNHARGWLGSESWQRWRRFPPVAQWLDEQGPALGILAKQAGQHLGLPVNELVERLLGGRLLVAVWPPANFQPGVGEGLALIEAADAEVVRLVLTELVAAQRRDGRLETTLDLGHDAGQHTVYVIRAPRGQASIYLCAAGRMGIVATSQQLVEQVLDQMADPQLTATLEQLADYREAQTLASADAPIRLFVHARAWDRLMTGVVPPADAAPPAERTLPAVWRSVQFAALGARLIPHPRVEATVRFDQQQLAPHLAEAVAMLGGESTLARALPADALVALAARFDVARFVDHLVDLGLPHGKDPQELIGMLGLAALVSGIGPEFGGFVVAPAADVPRGDAVPLPLETAAALETRGFQPGTPPAAQLLGPWLERAIDLAAAWHNNRHRLQLTVEHTASDAQQRQTTAALDTPLGRLTPTMLADDQWLWLATSTAALGHVRQTRLETSLLEAPHYRAAVDPRWPAPGHLLLVDLHGLRQLMLQQRAMLELLARAKGLDEATAQRSGKQLFALLSLADTMVVQARFDRQGVSLAWVLASHADSAMSPVSPTE